MFVELGAIATVTNSDFLRNFTDAQGEGGGLFVEGEVTSGANHFESNTAHKGAALAVVDGALVDAGSTYELNSAELGAGVACLFTNNCTLTDPWMESNSSEGGAAMFLYDAIGEVERGVFCQNRTQAGQSGSGDGGAILSDVSQLTVTNTVFFGNEAGGDGGATYWSDGTWTSANIHFLGNHAFGVGGALRGQSLIGTTTVLNSVNDLVAWNDGASGAIVTGGQVSGAPIYAHHWGKV